PLWEKYDNGDNLLFRQQDLEAPGKSALFYELLKLEDPAVRFLAGNLIDAARTPLGETPLLEDLLSGAQPATAPAPSVAVALPQEAAATTLATATPPVVVPPSAAAAAFAFEDPAPAVSGASSYRPRRPQEGGKGGGVPPGRWLAGAAA